jgi:hypothetical protein
MLIDGRCHCGRITYSADIDPAQVGLCHCTDCQTMSGSAFRIIVPAPVAGFKLLSGEPRVYVKTAESGSRRVQAFCADCGTPIYSAAEKNPPMYVLRVGAIRQKGDLRPSKQSWCRSAAGWVMELRDIEQFPTQSW